MIGRVVVFSVSCVAAVGAPAGAQCEVAQLVAPVAGDGQFAHDVALHQGVAVVGQSIGYFESAPSWVYELLPGGWTAGSPLPPTQPMTEYGRSVAVWGDTAVVAGQEENDPGVGATVFERVGGVWVQSTKLYTNDLIQQVSPGLTVAIEGDTIVLADRHLGAAFVFDRIGGVWTPTQTLSEPANMGYGAAVSLHDGRVVIGGCAGPVLGECALSGWVYERQGGLFVLVGQLAVLDPQDNDYGGYILAQTDDAILIGAPYHGLGFPVTSIGAVYVFERVGGVWTQTDFVISPFPALGDQFGGAVAAQGELLAVGAPDRDGPFTNSGAVYLYRRSGASWQHVVTLQASEPVLHGRFGRSLDVDGDTLLVGAWLGESGVDEGRVYVARGMLGITDWLPFGGAVAGVAGQPCAFGSGTPAVGAAASVTLVGAAPGAPAWLVLGVERINAPFKGGVLVPAPQLLLPLLTDAGGGQTFGWTWPPGLPPGLVLALQHWIVDAAAPYGVSGGNALVVGVP